jgi:hypothetical protein
MFQISFRTKSEPHFLAGLDIGFVFVKDFQRFNLQSGLTCFKGEFAHGNFAEKTWAATGPI